MSASVAAELFRSAANPDTGLISIPAFTLALHSVDSQAFGASEIAAILDTPGIIVNGKVNTSCFVQWLEGSLPNKAQQKRQIAPSQQSSLFLERWHAYKAVANDAIGENKKKLVAAADIDGNGVIEGIREEFLADFDADDDGMIGPSEYDAMEASIAEAWKLRVDAALQKKAEANGTTVAALREDFVQTHIAGIQAKGYMMDEAAKKCLTDALQRFFICDVGPAPFCEGGGTSESAITVSEHCLQMAMHWLRNPPEFLSVPELEELVVLAIFHDVFYYDDFTHHGARAVEMLKDYCLHEVPKAVVGGHLHLKPDKKALQNMQFASPLEALRQEWVQMDWYLTLVNVKQEATRSKRIGDGVVAPLEFFHHHLGHFFTKGDHMAIATAKTQSHNW